VNSVEDAQGMAFSVVDCDLLVPSGQVGSACMASLQAGLPTLPAYVAFFIHQIDGAVDSSNSSESPLGRMWMMWAPLAFSIGVSMPTR
jgi:hypothetical protein